MLRVARHRFTSAGKHLIASVIQSKLNPVKEKRGLAATLAESGCGRGKIRPADITIYEEGTRPRRNISIKAHEHMPPITRWQPF